MWSAPLAVGGGVSMDQICARVLLRSQVSVPCSAHTRIHLSSRPSMDGLSGMVTARCSGAGLVMAQILPDGDGAGRIGFPAGAGRLPGIGIDPAITGEPPEERARGYTGIRRVLRASLEPDGWARESLRQRAVVCPSYRGARGKRGGTAAPNRCRPRSDSSQTVWACSDELMTEMRR